MAKAVRQPNIEELEIINKHFAKTELKADNIYLLDIEAADDYTQTAYFSFLGTDMIEAFHKDVMARQISEEAELIGFLFGHDTSKIPSGTLFQSELVQVVDGETKLTSFRPSVYMVKDLKTSDISTDDYVKAYESGHTEAVSVGFQAGSYICSICGNDMRSWSCVHIPGRSYNIAPEGEPIVNKLCTYTVHQGSVKKRNLIELSGVYAGAMPGKRVKGEFSLPENSNLEVRDGKVMDGKGSIFASMNIKDFKESDVLRFNFQFDGSIEKVGEVDLDSDIVKSILEKVQRLENENKVLTQSLSESEVNFNKAHTELWEAKTILDEEKKNHNLTIKNLSLSEVDKVDLQKNLDVMKKKMEKMEIELQAKTAIADAYVKDLRERCSKLSIQINGMDHKPEIFNQEIAVLSIQDLKTKIEGLEKQLAQYVPVGRKTESQDKLHLIPKFNSNSAMDAKFFKFKNN